MRHIVDCVTGEIEVAPPTEADIADWESRQPTLAQIKAEALGQILKIITAFPGQVFGASPEKLAIYERKQALVNSWSGAGIPSKPQVEWAGDWAQRPELAAQGWVAVEALGRQFQCASAAELWETWKLNTALANYLDEQSEPIRTRAQMQVTAAEDAAGVSAAMGQFAANLAALPVAFAQGIAPGLIAASGLTVCGV